LHSDKDHQVLFGGGANTRITNPRWRTTAILEKSKNRHISFSATVWPIVAKFGTVTHFDLLGPTHPENFNILKIQDGGGCHLEKSKNSHISAAV